MSHIIPKNFGSPDYHLINHVTLRLRIVLVTILCLLFQIGWGAEEGNGDPIFREYYRLLNLANNGEASDKVSLFLYTA